MSIFLISGDYQAVSACALAVCRTKHIYGVVRFITSSDEPTILRSCIKEYNTMKTIGSRFVSCNLRLAQVNGNKLTMLFDYRVSLYL